MQVALSQTVDVELSVDGPLGFMVMANERAWVIADHEYRSSSLAEAKTGTFRFKASELVGRKWQEDGQAIEVAVFAQSGRYDLYFARDLETEPENTVSCLIRIEVITS